MFDLSFMLESMANVISALWEAFVDPIKPIWIVIVIAVLGNFYFRKSRTN